MIFNFLFLFRSFSVFFSLPFSRGLDGENQEETRQQRGLTSSWSNTTRRKHLNVSSPSKSLKMKITRQPRTGFIIFLCFCQSAKKTQAGKIDANRWTTGYGRRQGQPFSGRDWAPKTHRIVSPRDAVTPPLTGCACGCCKRRHSQRLASDSHAGGTAAINAVQAPQLGAGKPRPPSHPASRLMAPMVLARGRRMLRRWTPSTERKSEWSD